MLLLPFSSGAGAGSVVVAYGLPFLALAAVGFVLMQAADPRFQVRTLPYVVAGAMLAFALTVATTYAPSIVQSGARLVPNLIGYAVFLYLIDGELDPDHAYAARISAVYVWSAAVLSAYYLGHFLVELRRIGLLAVLWDRVTGGAASLPWGASNVVASCVIMPFFLTFFLSDRARWRRSRWAYATARLLMMGTLLVTLSRGAILSVLVGLLGFAVAVGGKQRTRLLAGTAVAVVAILLADHLLHGIITHQFVGGFLSRFQDQDIRTLNSRTDKYGEFLRLFGRSPLLGTGYYGTIVAVGGTGHNIVLTTLAERGVLGFLFSGVILLLAAWQVVHGLARSRTRAERLLFLSLFVGGASSLLHLLFEDANFTHQYIIYSWVALALAFVAAEERRAGLGTAPRAAPVLLTLDT